MNLSQLKGLIIRKELKDTIVRKVCIKTWRIWEKVGVHMSPNHYYWPIPETKDILSYDFKKKFSLDGIKISEADMLMWLKRIAKYREEYAKIHTGCGYTSHGDGAILYGMVRELKPKRVLEVGSGSGWSTSVTCTALEKNKTQDDSPGKIIAIEPYPKPSFKELVNRHDDVTLIQSKVEAAEPQLFEKMESGDILFIDSSHVVRIGNDVHYLYLSVLPKVPVGTIIHIHDIKFPYDYPKEWVLKNRRFWTEQYLLHMFLAFNDSFEILFAGNYMYDKYPELMVDSLVGLSPGGDGWPGCFWIRRKK